MAIQYHSIFALLSRRCDDLEPLPDVLFEFPDVHSLCAFGVVDSLRLNTACLPLRSGQEILLACLDR